MPYQLMPAGNLSNQVLSPACLTRQRFENLLTIEDWEHVAVSTNYSATEMARHCNISLRQLERFFRVRFSVAPKVWITRFRLQMALRMMQQGKSAKETAFDLGYKSISHFSRAFKREHGLTPKFILHPSMV